MRPSLRLWRAAAVAWAGVILASGLLPTQDTVHAISRGWDDPVTTSGHFAAYALLGFLLGMALGGREVFGSALLLGLALAGVLGGVIELLQGPLSYRDAQVSDFVVDLAGAAVGLAVFSAVARARRSRSRRG